MSIDSAEIFRKCSFRLVCLSPCRSSAWHSYYSLALVRCVRGCGCINVSVSVPRSISCASFGPRSGSGTHGRAHLCGSDGVPQRRDAQPNGSTNRAQAPALGCCRSSCASASICLSAMLARPVKPTRRCERALCTHDLLFLRQESSSICPRYPRSLH